MKSILAKLRQGLRKTRVSLVRRIRSLFDENAVLDPAAFEQLESALISADLGVDASFELVAKIRKLYELGEIQKGDDALQATRREILAILREHPPFELQPAPAGPGVVLITGVNGSGKTTSTAKLAHLLQQDGRSVLLGACDTFRAAGARQLRIWAERIGCDVVAGKHGGDAAATAFDAVQAARHRNLDFVLLDTAGRQHTRRDLMAELDKIRRAVAKACPGAPHYTLLTIDASTGSNALVQAREFHRGKETTGLILTKLDGSGKGGSVVAIARELGLPVCFVGLGEKLEDLQPFNPADFAEALFA